MKTVSKSFVSQVVAFLKGDDASVIGEKIWRQGKSAFEVEIARLNGDKVMLESKLEKAKEDFNIALLNNGQAELDRETYMSNIYKAQNNIVEAEEALEALEAKMAFLEDTYNKRILGV